MQYSEFIFNYLVENEVFHNKIRFLFQKLEHILSQNGPPAAILNFAPHIFQQLVHQVVHQGCDPGHM